jgi:hypothetical protein
MASQATRRRILNEVRRRIDEFGWAVQTVGACCSVPGCPGGRPDDPEFGYTVGLTRYDGHPELIITGVAQVETGHPLNLLGERIRSGERFVHGDTVRGIAADRPVRLITVDARASTEYLLHANALYRCPGRPPVPALQVVWPDCGGRYPWDPGCHVADMQPLLGTP